MITPSERLKNALTKDNLWVYILKLLGERNLYPYEIRDMVQKRFGFYPGNVTAYIVMKKLEADGYIRFVKILKESGPSRKYYKITEKGRQELNKAKKIYSDMQPVFK